jgi:hydrogenase maturation protease
LVYGYGNPGRGDDGLGPALVLALVERGLGAGVSAESGYQLAIEDAVLVAGHEVVVFADAHRTAAAPYELQRIAPRPGTSFTTHSLAPETLLSLAHEHFGCRTAGWTLGIRGYEFDRFEESLSPRARTNLAAAAHDMERALREGRLSEAAVLTAPER